VGNLLLFGNQKGPISIAWTYKESEDHTILVGFKNNTEKMDIYNKVFMQNAMQAFLPDVEVEAVAGYEWNLDPYTKGTWATYRPGWMKDYYDHFQKDAGRVIFASGDHGDGWRGTIDGAIGAGHKAAQRAKKIVG